MFDIAFTELLVIGIVALVVIGPERLPKVARTVGTWVGRLNRYVAQVKQDIDRDMQLEELRKLQSQMKETAQKYEILAQETGGRVQEEVEGVNKVLQAMASTDGGLTLREHEKALAETKAAEAQTATPPVTETPVADSTAEPAAAVAEAPVAPATPSGPKEREVFTSSLHDPVLADDMAPAAPRPQETKTA